MWTIPIEITHDIIDFCQKLNCDWVGMVPVEYHAAYDYGNCHNSVHTHVSIYGGRSVIGWYIVSGFDTLQAVRHTVWQTPDNELIDIIPYKDKRTYCVFVRSKSQEKDYSISCCFSCDMLK